MQLVRSYKVFCLLRDVALFVGRNKFGTNGRINDVEKRLLSALVLRMLSHPVDEMPYERLWYRSIDAIHRHVVAVVSCPTKRQLAEVARAHHEALHLIGCIHEDLRTFASL